MLSGLLSLDVAFQAFRTDLPREDLALLRHDVDSEIFLLDDLASIEHELGVVSTYFVMLSSTAYNIFSLEARAAIRRVTDMGHSLGLHFQAEQNEDKSDSELQDLITQQCRILSDVTECRVKSFSYHQPSHTMLGRNLVVPGLVNAYNFRESAGFTYTSDTNMEWRSGHPVELVRSGIRRLQILVHPMWWTESTIAMCDKWQRVRRSLNNTLVSHWMDRERSLRDLDTGAWFLQEN